MRSTAALVLILSPVAPLFALTWDQTTIERDTMGEKVNAEFHFTNKAAVPVRIQAVQTSCGCTVAAPQKREYAPGESGTLPVTHDPEGRTGVRAYRITVRTDEDGAKPDELILKVNIARQIEAGVRVAVWEQGEERAAKSIPFKIDARSPVAVTGAQPEKDLVSAEVVDGPAPGEEFLKITPKEDVAPGQTRIRLVTEPPLHDSVSGLFFAVLR
ncbi:MAG: DUF1573 domain-containing protein [Chthoniobacterales bacterium]|nr:DUF1573 domain-containing protein [Chthoniobacterales bacterium]